jgi:acyl-CoA synthetase (AMP-forming)/AMP-acid ligase II
MNKDINEKLKHYGPIIAVVLSVLLVQNLAGPEGSLTLAATFFIIWFTQYFVAKGIKKNPKKKRGWYIWLPWLNLFCWIIPLAGAIVAGFTYVIPHSTPSLKKRNTILLWVGVVATVVSSAVNFIG